MLDEEVIVKDAKNSSERFLILNLILVVLIPALLLGSESELTKGVCIVLGILAPLNMIHHKRIWIDAPTWTLRTYALSLLPFLLIILITIIGLFNNILVPNTEDIKGFFRLNTDESSMIISASKSILTSLIPTFVLLVTVASAMSLFFITESRYIIRRIFFFTSLGAACFALFGFLYKMPKLFPKVILPHFGDDAFSTFTDSSQWSAFAILWLGAAMTIATYSSQRYRLMTFSYSLKCFAILISLILLLSVLVAGNSLEITIALLLSAIGFATLCIDTIPTKENLARHWTSKFIQSKYKMQKLSIAPATYFFISLAMFISAITVAINSYNDPNERLLVSTDNNKITLAEQEYIISDAEELIKARPIFGWGAASFANVFSFKQGTDLGDAPLNSPIPDILRKLMEGGIVGLFLTAIMPLVLFVRWLHKRDFSKSGFILFATFTSVLLLSIFYNPMQSAAVLQSFWIIVIVTFKWDDCEVR